MTFRDGTLAPGFAEFFNQLINIYDDSQIDIYLLSSTPAAFRVKFYVSARVFSEGKDTTSQAFKAWWANWKFVEDGDKASKGILVLRSKRTGEGRKLKTTFSGKVFSKIEPQSASTVTYDSLAEYGDKVEVKDFNTDVLRAFATLKIHNLYPNTIVFHNAKLADVPNELSTHPSLLFVEEETCLALL